MRRPLWSVGNMDTHMALVVSEEKVPVAICNNHAVTPTFSIHAGSLALSVMGFMKFECDGDESNSQDCIVDTDLVLCSRIGIVTQCYSCKFTVGLNTCGVRIECIFCSTQCQR